MKYLLAMFALFVSAAMALPAQAQPQYPNGYYGQAQSFHNVLSAQDQQDFDKYYSKWVDASRKNDRDDISGNARHMQEIMARYNIPVNVPFDQVASTPMQGGYAAYPNQYPNAAYPGGYANGPRLSADDQQKFDKAYSDWMDAQRKNDRDDIDSNARKMQEIMARNGIPANVPFAAVATNGGYAAPNGAYGSQYPYAQQARLSSHDQSEFDKHYRKWVDARHKKDMDDVDKNERAMRDIMARNNIPANVPFDAIASPGAANH
jgi:hypothetical protein